MPKGHPNHFCRGCGKPARFKGELSLQGYHPECGEARQREYIDGLIEHRGPHFEHWRRRSLAALGVTLHDDPLPER